jgi:hypothetical protein
MTRFYLTKVVEFLRDGLEFLAVMALFMLNAANCFPDVWLAPHVDKYTKFVNEARIFLTDVPLCAIIDLCNV